jgi:hypothetical protein
VKYSGADINHELASIAGFLNGKPTSTPAQGVTNILKMTGDINVRNGIAETNNLQAKLDPGMAMWLSLVQFRGPVLKWKIQSSRLPHPDNVMLLLQWQTDLVSESLNMRRRGRFGSHGKFKLPLIGTALTIGPFRCRSAPFQLDCSKY